ncbi:MAG TPA: hypothetical protein VIW29_08255 [Polyangiaceae bacterium]
MARSNWSWLCLVAVAVACGGSNGRKGTEAEPGDTAGASGSPSDAGGEVGVGAKGGSASFGGTVSVTTAGQAPIGGQVGAGGTNAVLTPLESYPSAYAAAICQLIKRCWKTFAVSEPSSCEASLERQLREGSFANLAAAVEDGRIEYRPEAAAACLNETAAASCEDGLLIEPANCSGVFIGNLEADAACTLDAECGPERQCVTGDACPGKCGPLLGVGEACLPPNRCESGLLCAVGPDGGVCQVPSGLGEGCTRTQLCGSLQFCKGLDRTDPQGTGECAPRDELYAGLLGDPCSLGGASGLCELDLVCLFDTDGSTSGHCAERLAPGSPGAACQLALPDQCPRGQFCKVTVVDQTPIPTGECTANPQLGEPCLFEVGASLPAPCPTAQYCDTQTLRCEAGKRLGEACTTDAACYSKKCDTSGTCVAPLECE